MKALSIKQPWASLIVGGVPILESKSNANGSTSVVWNNKVILKDVENRSWATDYRGRIYIHAGKRFDDFDSTFCFLCGLGIAPIVAMMCFSKRLPLGAIIGEVDIVDCRFRYGEENDNLYSIWHLPGQYGFALANSVLYDKAIPCKGRLYFFEPDI